MNEDLLTIGQLAHTAGLTTSAIRYYERVGVLPEPERSSGQRRYGPEAVRRLQVLDVAKRAGFTLEEAAVLIAAEADPDPGAQLRDLAVRKLPEVEALIERAEAMREWLTHAAKCDCCSLEVCGLFAEDGQATARLPMAS
jgi:DNA-binding transcriptional MerR regulator